jgi:hypothetical protein
VETKIYVYEYHNFTDYTLWTVFQEDFEDFTADTFGKVRVDTRARLRTHLLRRGVYVATHNKRDSISKVLIDTIVGEEFHKWTDEEITSTLAELGSMASISLRKRLNPAQDSLVGAPQPPPSADPPRPPPPKDDQPPPLPPPPPSADPLLPSPPADPPRPPPPEDHQPPPLPPLPLATDGATSPIYSKEAATIAKIYMEDQKYNGVSESFDFKLAIFNCEGEEEDSEAEDDVVLSNGLTSHDSSLKPVKQLREVIETCKMWWDDHGGFVDIPEDEWMEIPLMKDWEKRVTKQADTTAFFHRWRIKPAHWNRVSIMTHRGQETSNIALIEFRNSVAYIQH